MTGYVTLTSRSWISYNRSLISSTGTITKKILHENLQLYIYTHTSLQDSLFLNSLFLMIFRSMLMQTWQIPPDSWDYFTLISFTFDNFSHNTHSKWTKLILNSYCSRKHFLSMSIFSIFKFRGNIRSIFSRNRLECDTVYCMKKRCQHSTTT